MKTNLQTMGQHKTFFIVLTFTLIFCFIIPTEKQGNFLYVLLNPSFYNFFGRKKIEKEKVTLYDQLQDMKLQKHISFMCTFMYFLFQQKSKHKLDDPCIFPNFPILEKYKRRQKSLGFEKENNEFGRQKEQKDNKERKAKWAPCRFLQALSPLSPCFLSSAP